MGTGWESFCFFRLGGLAGSVCLLMAGDFGVLILGDFRVGGIGWIACDGDAIGFRSSCKAGCVFFPLPFVFDLEGLLFKLSSSASFLLSAWTDFLTEAISSFRRRSLEMLELSLVSPWSDCSPGT